MRVLKGQARKRRSATHADTRPGTAGNRDWAKDAGIEASDRGRIAKAVREQYDVTLDK